MRVQNNPSFCGKVVCPPEVIGVEHLLTDAVKNRMRFAPRGSVLRFNEADFLDRCDIDFVSPRGAIIGIYNLKRNLTEGSVLRIIKDGIRIAKNGLGILS